MFFEQSFTFSVLNMAWSFCSENNPVDTSKFHVQSLSRFHRFWRVNPPEIMISIRRKNFDLDSAFKINKIWTSFPHGFFYVVLTLNQRNFCSHCFYSIISKHFLLWEPILNKSGWQWCNFNDIDVIADIGTIENRSFGNFAAPQIITNKDNFYLLQNNPNKDHNANIFK